APQENRSEAHAIEQDASGLHRCASGRPLQAGPLPLLRTKHLKGQCQACGWPIAFPAESVGTSIDCPHCGKSTELMLALPPEEPTIPRSTIVWTLITILLLLAGLGGALIAL